MNHRGVRLFVVVALVATLAACSFKTLYNRLDYLVPKYVEGVITLDDVLEDRLEERTLVLLQWHRSTQLKQYAAWLQSLQRDVGDQLTEEQLDQHVLKMEDFWWSLVGKLNDEMAYLLPLLDQEQQQELFLYLEDSNEEFREEYIEPGHEERIEAYADFMIDTYENWFGELTGEQEQAVELAATGLISTAELRLEQRLAWQRGIRDILAGDDSHYDKSQRLRVFLAEFETEPDGPLRQGSDTNRRILIRLTVQIAHSLTPEQKDYFVNKTGDYIRMFTELAENR